MRGMPSVDECRLAWLLTDARHVTLTTSEVVGHSSKADWKILGLERAVLASASLALPF